MKAELPFSHPTKRCNERPGRGVKAKRRGHGHTEKLCAAASSQQMTQSQLRQGLRARSVISAVPYPHPKIQSFPMILLGRGAINVSLPGDV